MGNKQSANQETLKIKIGTSSKEKPNNSNKIISSRYTILTFLPLNLYEQFRRIANIYFLTCSIIILIIDSPVSPTTYITPFIFMVVFVAIKGAYEDLLRHKQDRLVNNRSVKVIRDERTVEIKSQQIKQGDLVRVEKDEEVPADLVLLKSSDPGGKCRVMTANLDGETNLKTLLVPRGLPDKIDGLIECETPDIDLYSFNGKIEIPDRNAIPLSAENLLLRGSRVRNTEWVTGCAVYTGQSTKMVLNSRITLNKMSSGEKWINRYLAIFIVLMIVIMTVCFLAKRYYDKIFEGHFMYLSRDPFLEDSELAYFIQYYFSFMVLFNYLITIELHITLELQKLFGSLFLQWDLDLYDPEMDQPCIVNTSDINEELGQIDILFSDKTGTLTKNEMTFKECSIDGQKYVLAGNGLEKMETLERVEVSGRIFEFFEALSLCHKVEVIQTVEKNVFFENSDLKDEERDPIIHNELQQMKKIDYQGSSSDEKALLEASVQHGIIFKGDQNEILELRISKNPRDSPRESFYKRLAVLEFSSERKRMSVIVENEINEIFLYCKGAENVVLPLCTDTKLIQKTQNDVEEFAQKGLRTLVVAKKLISHDEFQKIDSEIRDVQNSFTEKQKNLERLYNQIETNLELLGATALEDALQTNVADTLVSLRQAGIQIWVLTGDKVETALNIAISSGHISINSEKFFITDLQEKDQLISRLDLLKYKLATKKDNNIALLIDGVSLTVALDNTPTIFRDLSIQCHAVLCCRLSPLQKSEVVKLMKTEKRNPICASIGDGANDVSMIQEAHVGLGIVGKEGRQAARCADYAFVNFSMVKKILLVHGHFYSHRFSGYILYFLYKNLTLMALQFLFQWNSLCSTQTVFPSFFQVVYNLAFTGIPILVYGLTEQPYKAKLLMDNPQMYKKVSKNRQFEWKYFFKWMILGIYESGIIYAFCYLLWSDVSTLRNAPFSVDFKSFGLCMMHLLVVTINLKLILVANFKNFWLIGSVIVMILFFVFVTVIYTNFVALVLDRSLLRTYNYLLTSTTFWLLNVIVVITALLPTFIVKSCFALGRKKNGRTATTTKSNI